MSTKPREDQFADYVEIARYRSHPSMAAPKPSQSDSGRLLKEIRCGVLEPLEAFLPSLRTRIVAHLTGGNGEVLGLEGRLGDGYLTYNFMEAEPNHQIIVRQPELSFQSVNVFNSRLQYGESRMIGLSDLVEAIYALIAARKLDGGLIWANERLAGRLRRIRRTHTFPLELGSPLGDISAELENLPRHALFRFSEREAFSVGDLLEDIETLLSAGRRQLDLWWEAYPNAGPLGTKAQSALRGRLDELYRRSQQIYRELVSYNFSTIASELHFQQAMPVRYDLQIMPGTHRVYCRYNGDPVADWDQAGADVKFPGKWTPHSTEGYYEAMVLKLERLGRTGCQHFTLGGINLPVFDGFSGLGGFDGETPALRTAIKMLIDDLRIVVGLRKAIHP